MTNLNPPIFHLIPRLRSEPNEFARAILFDQTLDYLSQEARLPSVWLCDSALELDQYLRLRPENFDLISRLAAAGRLEVGAWYVAPDAWMNTLEITIRNLALGLETLRVLGLPTQVLPLPPLDLGDVGRQLPQILAGFGISMGILEPYLQPLSDSYVYGLDGTPLKILTKQLLSAENFPTALTATTRHTVIEIIGTQETWEAAQQILPRPDEGDLLWSSYRLLSKANPLGNPPADAPRLGGKSPSGIGEKSVLWMLLLKVEPMTVWAQYETGVSLQQPQRIIQGIWRDLLQAVAQGDNLAPVMLRMQDLLSVYNLPYRYIIPLMVTVEGEGFQITAVKLRDDGQGGVVVRGYNSTGKAQPIQLHFWRDFATCEVLRLDEGRTGGQLTIEKRTVQFMAHPHRLLTFWLRD